MLRRPLGKKLFRLLPAGQIPIGNLFLIQFQGFLCLSLRMENLALHVDCIHPQENIVAALQGSLAEKQQLLLVGQKYLRGVVRIASRLVPHIIIHHPIVIWVLPIDLLGQAGILLLPSRPKKPAVLLYEASDLFFIPGGIIAHQLIYGHGKIIGKQGQKGNVRQSLPSLPLAHGGAGNAHGRRQPLLCNLSFRTQPLNVCSDINIHFPSFSLT